jgi:hypothetical protein
MKRGVRVTMLAICTVASASIVFAQGNPHGLPPGQTKRAPKVPNTSGLVAPAEQVVDVSVAPSTRVRSFGAWLDDASALAPGEGWLSLSMSKWSMPIATGADVPAIDLSVGVAPAVQMSVTLPYFKVSDRAGNNLDGFGDVYIASKIVLRDAAIKSFGVSIGPTLEYLSRTSTTGTGLRRVNWILPLNLERRLSGGRLYGSTGYFSRGVFFASGAFEWPLNDKLVASAALSHSYVTDDEAMSEAIGLSRRRMDASGTLAYSVSPALALFGSLGRTVWKRDEDSTDLLVSGGVSVNISRGKTPHK